MRVLVLLFVLLSMPVVVTGQALAQETQQKSSGSGSQATPRHPGDYCTRHCRPNEIPCGTGCMAKGGSNICSAKRTTTCAGKP